MVHMVLCTIDDADRRESAPAKIVFLSTEGPCAWLLLPLSLKRRDAFHLRYEPLGRRGSTASDEMVSNGIQWHPMASNAWFHQK